MRDRIDVRPSLQFREGKISSVRRRVALEKVGLGACNTCIGHD